MNSTGQDPMTVLHMPYYLYTFKLLNASLDYIHTDVSHLCSPTNVEPELFTGKHIKQASYTEADNGSSIMKC